MESFALLSPLLCIHPHGSSHTSYPQSSHLPRLLISHPTHKSINILTLGHLFLHIKQVTRRTCSILPTTKLFPHHCLSSPPLNGVVVQLQNTPTDQVNPSMNQNGASPSFISWSLGIPVWPHMWAEGKAPVKRWQSSWGLGHLIVWLACVLWSHLCSVRVYNFHH